ncbi:MATE family efflux transporter [Microbulbifer harenosus]|uniref:Multidrug export protein MepA n=1 Tax=Microbulbifer harenosus TaxID=2576840 RepID=A0ABY2UK26_9GAMM|nr:MATE family efflux transporter [Microbulbifer harenosus]TLM75732.1 MATE family efflux transporter [Microbulbifer harenosus]
MTERREDNKFLSGSLGSVFAKTAAPIILIMLVNGSFNLVDAYFLGIFVGADALTAVTSMFPAVMLVVALSTLVSNGFASVMARILGAGDKPAAREAFAQAISLSLLVCLILIALFLMFGKEAALLANGGSAELAHMSYTYISILVLCSPLMFILNINGDSLRCEGQVGFMALISLASVLFNGVLNYIFIAQLNMGVAGSAYGTVVAQLLSLLVVFNFRRKKKSPVNIQVVQFSLARSRWKEFLALGAPSSLTYVGLALSSAAILYNLQIWNQGDYATTVGAYGIITRLMTFVFLPLLGLSMAFQSITGNNVGAKKFQRTNSGIKIAILSALIYCLLIEALIWLIKDRFGYWFVDDVDIAKEVARILPISTLALFLLGPLMMINMFFQSIGDAARASFLSLSKTYLFALPLVFLLPMKFGETGIWLAGPVAEGLALLLTLGVLFHRAQRHQYRLGLFYTAADTV